MEVCERNSCVCVTIATRDAARAPQLGILVNVIQNQLILFEIPKFLKDS